MKDIEKLDYLPKKESMNSSHRINGYDMKQYDNGWRNYKIVSRYIRNYLKKSIGKNYDKVKKHIIEKLKDFKARRQENLAESILGSYIGDEFIIDSQGRVQKNKSVEELRKIWRIKEKTIRRTIVIDNKCETFKLRSNITQEELTKLRNLLVVSAKIYSADDFEHLVHGGSISYDKFHSIFGEFDFFPYSCWRFRCNESDFILSCFETNTPAKMYYFKDNNEWKQWQKEKKDKINKQNRERERLKKAEDEMILCYIENNKKLKEREKDVIDRDRFGFNEESFKGEPYHGHKRKKK